jgi:hypothetical protein
MAETGIITNFPHAVLTPLPNERPTQQLLHHLHREINANAASVHSNRGNGALGHLALVVPEETYLNISNGVLFEPPVNPGAAPTHAPLATGAQISETNRQFLANLTEFRTFIQTEAALKKQLIQAVPLAFISQIQDDLLGFAPITTLEILTHLDTTYGTLTTDDLDRNITQLHKDWNPTEPLETLFQQIRKCIIFAATTDPISEPTAVRAGLSNLQKSGLFTDALRDWRKRPTAEHTFDNFRLHFTLADQERHRSPTTRSAGYHTPSANAAITSTPPTESLTPAFYCWSHGLGYNPSHTSPNCRSPAPGHQKQATLSNMCGGCATIQRKRGETAVYVRPPRSPAAPTAARTP